MEKDKRKIKKLAEILAGNGQRKTLGEAFQSYIEDLAYMPEHEWNGTMLRFENPDGEWSDFVDLKGEKGEKGEPGSDGYDGLDADEDKIIASVLSRIVLPKDGRDGKNGKDGKSVDEDSLLARIVARLPKIDNEEKLSDSVITKIKGLTGNDRIPLSAIRDAELLMKLGSNNGKKYDMSDQRWHGGGLSTVTTDSTLTGDGTPEHPLKVVGGGGGGGVWGSITGDINSQLDLQAALNDRVPYTGATSDVDLGTHLLTLGSEQFSTGIPNPTWSEGLLFYDNTKKALSYYNEDHEVTLNIGQETVIRVYNNSGSTISNGVAVYPTGAVVGNITIGLADASVKAKCRLIGVTTSTIENNSFGYVTKIGEVGGLNTTAFSSGDTIYLSATTPGGFTNVQPVGDAYVTILGAVKVVNATTGSIIVDITGSQITVNAASNVGWSPTNPCTLAFVDGTRTLTLTPTASKFVFYQYGDKYSNTTDSIVIPDQEGLFYVYYDMGTLTYIKNPNLGQIDTIIRNNPTVAQIYWNTTNKRSEFFGKETHQIGTLSGMTHAYLHFEFGARYTSGLGLNTLSVEASGNLNTSSQFGVDAGAIVDEDLYFPTSTIASTTGLPIYYLAGTSAAPVLRRTTNAGYSVLTAGTGRLAYNFLTGGNWTLTEVTNGDFVLYHIAEINENDISKRVVSFMGQSQYATIAAARTAATSYTDLQALIITGLVPQEAKFIATVVYETQSVYSSATKSRIRQIAAGVPYVDLRTVYFNGTTSSTGGSGGGSTVFNDSTFAIFDDGDATKQFQFQASGISAGQTRTLTIQDKDITVAGLDDVALKANLSGATFTGAIFATNLAGTNTGDQTYIAPRVVTTTDDSTAVIDVTTTDVYELSAIANNTTFSTTGSPTNGHSMIIRFKDAGVSKTLTWDAIFVAIGVTLPSATVAGKWHYVGVKYNSNASKYHVLAVSVQA
jgi:hypothetical protein